MLLNRPNDYHRDHRYTSQLVLDAVYMLMVPLLCPETPAMKRMPVLAYWFDGFIEGGAFRPDVVVPIDAVAETKARCIGEHESQIFEWLPYVGGQKTPPADAPGRRQFTLDWVSRIGKRVAARCGERRTAHAARLRTGGGFPDQRVRPPANGGRDSIALRSAGTRRKPFSHRCTQINTDKSR